MSKVVKKTSKILLTALLLFGTGSAHGHPETAPQAVNRYLSVLVSGVRAEVILTLVYGDVPARTRRMQIDRDQNGHIDEGEQREAERVWAQEGAAMVDLRLDGQKIAWTGDVQLSLGANRTVAAVPLVLEIATTAALDDKEHQLDLVTLADPASVGETEITIDLSTAWRLRDSQKDGVKPQKEPPPQHKWPAPGLKKPGPLRAHFEFRKEGRSEPPMAPKTGTGGPSPAIVLTGAGLLGAAGLAAWKLNRRRQRRPQDNNKAARI